MGKSILLPFTIENQLNGRVLYAIGSSCIKKFERDDLKHEVDVKEQLFKLLHAVEKDRVSSIVVRVLVVHYLLYLV